MRPTLSPGDTTRNTSLWEFPEGEVPRGVWADAALSLEMGSVLGRVEWGACSEMARALSPGGVMKVGIVGRKGSWIPFRRESASKGNPR